MDEDGFAVQGRKRKGKSRGPLDSFLREVPKYSGTDEDFAEEHARQYGREEGLGPDGRHRPGHTHFPRGTDRANMHKQYSSSTKPRVDARLAYQAQITEANERMEAMGVEERDYYGDHTGGLPPYEHELLDPRAGTLRDLSIKNADGRRAFLEKHEHGYHSAFGQKEHHRYAAEAYEEYESARDQKKIHEKHRSYSNTDRRKDLWGRPLSHR